MALNFTFTGDCYDQNDALIDCSYQLFYYSQNVISPIHNTENGQYNINAGEDSHLGIEGELSNGDVVLIKFEANELFCIFKYIHDGSGYNVQDVKLIPSQIPSVTLYINNANIGDTVIATNSSSDEYQYSYSGTTLYHKSNWYGFSIFSNKVGIDEILYEFNNGGYSDKNSSIFNSNGDFEVTVKVKNKYGIENTDTKIVRIFKNMPTVTLSNSPLLPYKNEETTIDIDIVDNDNTIVNTVYEIDDVVTDLVTHSFNEIAIHTFEVQITWNNGFEDKYLSEVLLINMSNIPPTVEIEYSKQLTNYTFSLIADDVDGVVTASIIEIYYTLPFDGEEVKVETINNNLEDVTMEFLQSGAYRIKAIVYDDIGATGTDEVVINIESSCDSGQGLYIEWE